MFIFLQILGIITYAGILVILVRPTWLFLKYGPQPYNILSELLGAIITAVAIPVLPYSAYLGFHGEHDHAIVLRAAGALAIPIAIGLKLMGKRKIIRFFWGEDISDFRGSF